MCVCAFVWLVDPLHVGPPAPGPLTHIIKGKGLPPSIRSHKYKGHIIICIICLILSPLRTPLPPCPYHFFLGCWCFFCWSLKSKCMLCLTNPFTQSRMFIYLCGVYMPKQLWSIVAHQHPHLQNPYAHSRYLSLLVYTIKHNMDLATTWLKWGGGFQRLACGATAD